MCAAAKTTLFALLAAGAGCKRTRSPVEPAPVVAVHVSEMRDAAASVRDASVDASPVKVANEVFTFRIGDTSWVKAVSRDKTFTTVHAPRGSGTLLIEWRIPPSRQLLPLPQAEDYGGNHVSRVELRIGRDGQQTVVMLGEHAGHFASLFLTKCKRQGYKLPANMAWAMPKLDNLVSTFSVETMQATSDFVLVAGDVDRLHLLRRSTYDGSCPERVKQGPLESCVDTPWQRYGEILLGPSPGLRATEELLNVAVDGSATPFDCKNSYSGGSLLDP